MGSFLFLSSIFHFSSGADTSKHEKDVQESTEGKRKEDMCHESLDNGNVGDESLDNGNVGDESLGENENISTDYEY